MTTIRNQLEPQPGNRGPQRQAATVHGAMYNLSVEETSVPDDHCSEWQAARGQETGDMPGP